MPENRGGRNRRRRLDRSERLPIDHGDDDVDHSEGFSPPGHRDPISHGRRNTELDDALFGFFMKQSLNTMKRNFSDFCQDTFGSNEFKRRKLNAVEKSGTLDGVDRSAFSRFGLKYFFHVLKKLNPEQRAIIQKFGFGCLLLFECPDLPSDFCRWVADCVDPVCSQMSVCGKSISISKDTFRTVLGLPIGGLEVPSDREDGKAFILSLFKVPELPHITFFGNKLISPDPLGDLEVFVCFMSVAISCLLCPDLCYPVNIKYLSVLKDPAAARDYDFSQLVYSHCLNALNVFNLFAKSKGRRMKSPVCCMYVPVVRYLDCLDFGIKNVSHVTPRVYVWKGDMIRVFSELDRKSRHQFGKKNLKEVRISGHNTTVSVSSQGNGSCRVSPMLSPLSHDFRTKAREVFVSSLQPDVIDGIISIGDKFLSTKSLSSKRKLEVLVQNVLDFLGKSSIMHDKVVANKSEANQSIDKQPQLVVTDNKVDRATFRVDSEDLQQKFWPTAQGAAKPSGSTVKRTPDPVTPECVITKFVKGRTHPTAPAMPLLRKVKSRNCQMMSGEDEQNTLNRRFSSDAGKGPIPIVDVPDSPAVKPHTKLFKLNQPQPIQKHVSKIAPIQIADFSPKPSVNAADGGIHLVGSNQFQKRCYELSKEADSTYNSLLMPNQHNQQDVNGAATAHDNANGADGEAVANDAQNVRKCRVQVKYMFVNWLMTGQTPPLQCNPRFPISEEDIIHYSAIVELAHSSIAKESGIHYPKVHCSYKSLGESLMPRGEVDNFIIPCFCRVLFEERHPSKSGRHYFFPNIGDAILKYNGEQQEATVRVSFEGATSASKGRKLGHRDNKLFFPIVNTGHWIAFVVDFEEKLFAFLDSYYDENSAWHVPIKNRLVDNFVCLWELIISQNHNFHEFQTVYPAVPKQRNKKDCGVFMIKLMETWRADVDTRSIFSYQDILNIRIQYANKLYFYLKNQVDQSLVTEFYALG